MSGSGEKALPIGSTMLIIFAIGGLFLLRTPLKSVRPPVSAGFESTSFLDQNVNARLWQDPVGAVDNALAQHRQRLQERTGLFEAIAGDLAEARLPSSNSLDHLWADPKDTIAAGEEIRLLPVILTPGYTAVAVEARRRSRQAVIYALAESEFAPSSGSHIGYFGTCWRHGQPRFAKRPQIDLVLEHCEKPFFAEYENARYRPTASAGAHREEYAFLPVPFEWFVRPGIEKGNDARRDVKLLVLWIGEDKLQADFVGMLQQIVHATSDHLPELRDQVNRKVTVIGPAGSTGLRKIMARRRELARSAIPKGLEDLGLFLHVADGYLDEPWPRQFDPVAARADSGRTDGDRSRATTGMAFAAKTGRLLDEFTQVRSVLAYADSASTASELERFGEFLDRHWGGEIVDRDPDWPQHVAAAGQQIWRSWGAGKQTEPRLELIFYSARATAPEAWLVKDIAGANAAVIDVAPEATSSLRLTVRRTLANDDRTLDLLEKELAHRIPATSPDDTLRVAIFVEWDSHY